MADEPRRSVRATKGQHTKSLDTLDQTVEPKKKGGKKSKKQEVEVIRCVCGVEESAEGDEDPWIACDSCGTWQHNFCVGVSTFEDEIPKKYFCEQCDPAFHKPLLDALEKGHKLWEDREREYRLMKAQEQADEEEEAKVEEESKKKGKRGKGKRTSDQHLETPKSTNGKAKSPSLPLEPKKEKKDSIPKVGSAKKNVRDGSQDHDLVKEPQAKKQKVATSAPDPTPKSPQSDLPASINDLEQSRKACATLISKSLTHAIPIAIKAGVYASSPNDTVAAKVERLSIQVEDAIYVTHPDKQAYTKQARSIAANLKGNQELCNGLLSRTLSPQSLAVMTTDDMASSELKKSTAEMKARSDKQAIMITDDGPRVRRTHKGEEVVGGDDFAEANDIAMSTSRRRSMLDPNADVEVNSRENSPNNEVELPDSIEDYRNRVNVHANSGPKRPSNIDTKSRQEPTRKASESNFDISKVFSSVQSPTSPQSLRRASSNFAPQSRGAGEDADVDRMLQDDDGNDSPPYSPAEYPTDPEVVWKGTVLMDSISKFSAVAKHVAGADLSKTMSWSDLLPKELKIAGRISPEHANDYLCSLRYSPQTDVVVVEVTRHGEATTQDVRNLYDYFMGKSRYGVMTNKGTGNIRDTYLIPVPPSPAKLPDFVTNLEGHKLPEHRPEPVLLVALVIRNDYVAPPPLGLDGTSDFQTPIIAPPQRQMSVSGIGPAMSPIQPQGAFPPTPSPSLPVHGLSNEAQQANSQIEGELNAARILGERVHDPTVAFLMPQAFHMRTVEWEIIRDILETDMKARQDLQHLSQVLEARMMQQGQNRQ